MKELRCIVFNDREVVGAIIDRRRRISEPLPDGGIQGFSLSMDDGTPRAKIKLADGHEVDIGEQELQASLVAYCMAKQIPLPVDAEKVVHLIRGKATLMVTMNFQKGARLITAKVAEQLDDHA